MIQQSIFSLNMHKQYLAMTEATGLVAVPVLNPGASLTSLTTVLEIHVKSICQILCVKKYFIIYFSSAYISCDIDYLVQMFTVHGIRQICT